MNAKAQEMAVDQRLVARMKEGDADAFNEVISLHWDKVYGMVLQFLRNEEDAEEVTQDTFIKAHRGMGDFRGDAALSTWLYRIATNLARSRYWYWWRRKRSETISIDAPIGEGDLRVSDVVAAEEASPDSEVLSQEFVDRIAIGMDRLSKNHREILTLRNIKNLSYEEIAAILGVSVGTVKSRIARARESLRGKMEKKF